MNATAQELRAALEASFRDVNPEIDTVTLLEARLLTDGRIRDAAERSYVVLAHGIRSGAEPGPLEDEQFGLFLVDGDMTRVIKTLTTITTPRWRDYFMWIDEVTDRAIVLVGEGATYRDQARRWVVWLDD